jgi:hypothetical protein
MSCEEVGSAQSTMALPADVSVPVQTILANIPTVVSMPGQAWYLITGLMLLCCREPLLLQNPPTPLCSSVLCQPWMCTC